MLRAEAELDRTGHFPLEALVAAHLDRRPERWAEVARQVAGGRMPVEMPVEMSVEMLVESVVESAANKTAPQTTAETAPQTPAASAIAAPPVHAAPSASTA